LKPPSKPEASSHSYPDPEARVPAKRLQTTASHQIIRWRHPAERKNVGQKSSLQRSVCRSPTSLKPIIAEYAEIAFPQLSL
ncbi:hypothetical protein, partial [Bradyrhizobium sp. CCBAU 11386]|uniref:hypothetical protein n=1 Tax=Bradyrhizobium sp. CCBAU 11386 TaxID=1630837 RepID=UPI0023031A34